MTWQASRLCQRCHILHDKLEHLPRQRLTYMARRMFPDLFMGPYRSRETHCGSPLSKVGCVTKQMGWPRTKSKKGGRCAGADRPGGPSEVVRLPLPPAAIAKRMKDGRLRTGVFYAFLDMSAHTVACAARLNVRDLRLPQPIERLHGSAARLQRAAGEEPAATFAVRIFGESMRDKGLYARRHRRG